MHVTKGGWLGQTFALAKFDDSSEGKKSRIRRSKEERKRMVETFIKRYQKLNNGDFPSLGLTRKEVGGSFYTVREIVREIIQENRVLGPPKLPPGDQNMENLDSFLEHHPLGSMSVDHHVHVVPPKDPQTLLEEYEFGSAKVLNTRSITELHPGKLDSDNIVAGGMNTTERNEEVKDPGYTELLVERGEQVHKGEEEIIYVETSRVSGGDVLETTHGALTNENNEQMHTGSLEIRDNKEQEDEGKELEPRVSQISDNVVETTHFVSNEESSERKDTENRELAIGKNKRFVCNEMQLFDNSTDVVDIKLEEEITDLLPESMPTLASQTSQNHLSAKESIVLDASNHTDVKVEDTLPAEEKTLNGANRTTVQNLNSNNSCIPLQQSTLGNRIANTNKSNDEPGGHSQKKRTNASLNRINLESWKAASKKSNGQETNRLVTFIRAFITTFVKFWSE